jgi:hypothetical protein
MAGEEFIKANIGCLVSWMDGWLVGWFIDLLINLCIFVLRDFVPYGIVFWNMCYNHAMVLPLRDFVPYGVVFMIIH